MDFFCKMKIREFRTISCGIGNPIPHEIVRKESISRGSCRNLTASDGWSIRCSKLFCKKSPWPPYLYPAVHIYIYIYIYVYIYTYVYMYVNMYILICYLMLIYICNICMNFSPIEPRYIILHFIIRRLHLLYYIIHSFILYLNSPLLASVYTLSYIYIK